MTGIVSKGIKNMTDIPHFGHDGGGRVLPTTGSGVRPEPQTNEPMLEPMLQFFEFKHLPPELAHISAPFAHLAKDMVDVLPRNPERSAALRKLLEAKDCAVRAKLYR